MPYKRATYRGPGIPRPVQPSPLQRRDQSSPPLVRAARLSCHAPPRTLWTAAAFVAANASAEFVEGASAAVSSRGHASSRTWRSCRCIAVRLRVCEGGALCLRLKKIRYGSKVERLCRSKLHIHTKNAGSSTFDPSHPSPQGLPLQLQFWSIQHFQTLPNI